MDLGDSPQEAVFREEVRAFVAEHGDKAKGLGGMGGGEGMPDPEQMRSRMESMKAWRDALVSKGWIAPAWPKE
jgi:hypothetical protein